MKRLAKNPSAAFTLIEILLVIVIVIALMAVLIPNLRSNLSQANKGAAEMYVQRLVGDLALYEATNGFPPTTAQGLMALVQKPTSEPIPRKWNQREDKIEKDPWGMDYIYEYPGKHNKTGFDIYSPGPDRQPGTDDDIGNWSSN